MYVFIYNIFVLSILSSLERILVYSFKLLRYRYGLECLFRFYSYGLETHFRPLLYKDFQKESLEDVASNQLYGLEKFWAFLKYYKNADSLTVCDELKEKLEKYKTIEDFRVERVSDEIEKFFFVSVSKVTDFFLVFIIYETKVKTPL